MSRLFLLASSVFRIAVPILLLAPPKHLPGQSGAPPVLLPDEAVRIALENNFDIRLVAEDAAIAQANNTRGNAGLLPTVNLVANENFTLSAFQQRLANGNEFNARGAPFNVANASIQLNWTLFEGGRLQIAKKRLEELEALGQLNLQNQVQRTAANVLLAYYEIVRSRMQERATEEVIALNEERLTIAEARLAAGFAGQNDALQARVDLNQRRTDLLLQQQLTASAKRSLNLLLARPTETPFSVQEIPSSEYAPDPNALREKILRANPGLLSLQKAADVAALTVSENKTLYKPRIVGNSQLLAQRSDNGSGFLLNNTQAGLTVGASFLMPIYTGGNLSRQVQTAEIAARQASLRLEAERLSLDRSLNDQIALFSTLKEVLRLEEENLVNARESLNVSTERFRLGQTTALEVQAAQNSLEQALVRRNLAITNLKNSEVQLRLLAGEL